MTFQPRQTVVVPVEFSPESAPAVREALDLSENASSVHVIHVLPRIDSLSPDINVPRLETGNVYMKTFLDSHDIDGVHTEILIGDPGHEIAKYARDCNCLLYTSPSPRDLSTSRMPSSA